jgi:hypothetical protein
MVEWKTDYYMLSYFQDVLQKASGDDRLSLLPGGGAGSLDSVMQLYLGWGRPFVALLDSDKAGSSEAARYEKKFGALIKPRLIQLSDASGKTGAKGIESLLSDSDKIRFQQVVDPAATEYKKKTLALGVQEALVAKHEVTVTQGAQKALQRTLDTLRQKLEDVS